MEDQNQKPNWKEALTWVFVFLVTFGSAVCAAIWAVTWLAWLLFAVCVFEVIAVWAVVRACLGRENVIATSLRRAGTFLSTLVRDEAAGPQGEPILGRWPRALCAALVCAFLSIVLVLARHALRPDPFIGWNMVVIPPLAAFFSAFMVVLAAEKRVKRWFRLAVFAPMAGVAVCCLFINTPIPFEWGLFGMEDAVERAIVEMTAGLMRKMGDPAAASRIMRLPYVAPVLLFGTAILAFAMTTFNVSAEPNTSLRRRLLAYPVWIAGILFFRALVPPLVLLDWPSGGTLRMAFRDAHWWVFIVMAAGTDAGQAFGNSALFARHRKGVFAGLGIATILLLVVFWKPVLAEYSYMRATMLACERGPDTERDGAPAALARAYRLRPDNEKYAYAYADQVLLGQALDLISRHEYDEALRPLEEARQVFPRSPSLYGIMGLAHSRRGDTENAIASYREAVDISRLVSPEDLRKWGGMEVATSTYERRLIDALAKRGDEESFHEVLTFLEHEDVDVVVHAIEALAEHKLARAVEPLRELRSHAEERVRQAASLALTKLTQGE